MSEGKTGPNFQRGNDTNISFRCRLDEVCLWDKAAEKMGVKRSDLIRTATNGVAEHVLKGQDSS